MKHYIVNLTGARISLFDGSLQLNPAGRRGYVKPLPRDAQTHREVEALKRTGKVRVLTAEQYRLFLSKGAIKKPLRETRVEETPVGAVEEAEPEESEPEEPEEEESEPEESEPEESEPEEESEEEESEEEEAEEEESEEEESEEESEESALLSSDDFQELRADEQRDYLTDLGIEGDFSNQEKRTSLYEEHLSS